MKRTFSPPATLALALVACAEPTAGPRRHPEGAVADAVKFWKDGASVYWNGGGRELAKK